MCSPMPNLSDEQLAALSEQATNDFRPCDECGEPVNVLEQWQQVVEGGAAIAKGHQSCIEAEWGPA